MKRPAQLLALFISLAPVLSLAQGVLVVINPEEVVRLPRPIIIYPPHPAPTPTPPQSYKIKAVAVQAKLVDQVARVQVSQSFVNTGSRQMEVCFVFPLPYDGAIDQLTLLVDGKEFPAKLLDAKQARQQYEAIVRKNKDPALLEWVGTGMFKTSVFPVPPGAERKVSLRYNQLLRKDRTLTDFLFPLSTAKYTSHAVENLDISVTIESASEIKNVYSPTHAVEIKRPSNHSAVAKFAAKNVVPTADFRLFFDVAKGELGASVLSYRPKEGEDGYFLLLASPRIKTKDAERAKKTVVFVLDRSGSMSGKKIEQAKDSLKFVLNNLRQGDLFNIVAYDSVVESFRPELEKYTEETRSQAIGFVEGLYAGGGTNIEGALKSALGHLQDSKRPNFVIFLTDGLPTVGETNEGQIVASAKSANGVHARIMSMGVGYDVNSRLLDRISATNHGQSDFVRPDEDIEAHVSKLYNRIGSPVMTDVAVKFEYDELRSDEGNPINRLFPEQSYDLFEGEQLVVVGRYRKAGQVKVKISGEVAGRSESFAFPAKLIGHSGDESYAFVEKLWAMRRIGDIINELDLHGKNEELIKELVELSTTHGILTPYTSFLADENADYRRLATNVERAEREVRALDQASGIGGFAQRAEKARFLYAEQPQAATAQARPAAEPLAESVAKRAGGFGGGLPGLASGPVPASGTPAINAPVQLGVTVRDKATDREVVARGVRQIGNKAFYQRAADKVWCDSTVNEAMEQKAVTVKQFSDDYFRLCEKHGKKLSQYLVFDEPALVNLEGTVYRIDPAVN